MAAWKIITGDQKMKGEAKYDIKVSGQLDIIEDFPLECDALRSLQGHPNIIKFFGWMSEFSDGVPFDQMTCKLSILLEFCNSDLSKLLEGGKLTPQVKKKIALQLADALKYVHSKGYLHRDLKPDNVLLNVDQNKEFIQLKLSDMGLSRRGEVITGHTLAGTPLYMAPEILNSLGYDKPVDVWSFSLILWQIYHNEKELHKGFPEFNSLQDFVDSLNRGVRPKINNNLCPTNIEALLNKCWTYQSLERPSFNRIVEELEQ